MSLLLRAPAKINLSLRIKSRRPDGFHEIETLMAPLELSDEVELTIAQDAANPQVELICDDATLPTDGRNLAHRAATAFLEATKLQSTGVRIRLSKQIPHGAGLGGGSSDAASVLLGLNRLLDQPLTLPRLAEIAGNLGSDVPFFLYSSAAICRGRGELVEPISFSEKRPVILIKPAFGVASPWAYRQWKDSRELDNIPYAEQKFSWGSLVNDLERPVFEKFVFLASLKRWLLTQTEVAGALMSGSGSTVFAIVDEKASDSNAQSALIKRIQEQCGSGAMCVQTKLV